MAENLLSVGVDVGTTTTQLVVSCLQIENRASSFSVPEMQITRREIQYKSPVHFTPLLDVHRIDGDGVRRILLEEYQRAGIRREDVDTGAIIITGETSRKENARAVLAALTDLAGDFVVSTAGPDLESVLAAKGAGADIYSEKTGETVLHMDIGGGTSNLALLRDGVVVKTGCLNVGGRLVKMDVDQRICYISPVLRGIFTKEVGSTVTEWELEDLAGTLVEALEMAAGLRDQTDLLDKLLTVEAEGWEPPEEQVTLSFSGGVADCIEPGHLQPDFGDIGPILGRMIRKSRLCGGKYRLGQETIRATVIGAGCHSAQLSGSTVFYRNVEFPMKNLPVVGRVEELRQLDGPGVLALRPTGGDYAAVREVAEDLARTWPQQPVLIAMEEDMAKALGHALALRLPKEQAILCIDRVRLKEHSFLDVGAPVASALPVVIKTLILRR